MEGVGEVEEKGEELRKGGKKGKHRRRKALGAGNSRTLEQMTVDEISNSRGSYQSPVLRTEN